MFKLNLIQLLFDASTFILSQLDTIKEGTTEKEVVLYRNMLLI
jgi:hypothetical protein